MAKTTKKTARPNRIPVGANRDVLTVDGIPDGYVGRWVNDTEGRIQKFLDGGYEFVTEEGVTVGERTVDNSEGREKAGSVKSRAVGQGITAYLMAIKKEWYEEDQTAKASEIAENETELFRKLNSGSDGTYGGVDKY